MTTRIITSIFAIAALAGSTVFFVLGIALFSTGGTIFLELVGASLMIAGSTLLVASAVFAAIEQSERIRQVLEDIHDRSCDVVDRLDRLTPPSLSPPSARDR